MRGEHCAVAHSLFLSLTIFFFCNLQPLPLTAAPPSPPTPLPSPIILLLSPVTILKPLPSLSPFGQPPAAVNLRRPPPSHGQSPPLSHHQPTPLRFPSLIIANFPCTQSLTLPNAATAAAPPSPPPPSTAA
ncbi:proline-rich receptor-like protein kinase PERK2 [Arachis stenosperma]|uniref:proline-rich receptor-like protein kinase PERK2 n=1 Tax=Arachis stenosperma TaxID=217475 RepID=UPI0025AD17C2|nr:proline-rich receptor-like protein kinase PERK2 [Arachis stenosperma]